MELRQTYSKGGIRFMNKLLGDESALTIYYSPNKSFRAFVSDDEGRRYMLELSETEVACLILSIPAKLIYERLGPKVGKSWLESTRKLLDRR